MRPSYRFADPFRDLVQLQNSLMHAFAALDGGKAVHSHGEHAAVSGAWAPLIDVREAQDRIVVEVELAGVAEKDIDLRLEGNTLTLRGERKFDQGVEREGYRLIERTHGSFHRSFTLPEAIDGEHVTAESRNGVLYICLPKLVESMSRQIKVQAHAGLLPKVEGRQ